MTKRHFTLAFKKEVLEYISNGHNPNAAANYFSERDSFRYDTSLFYQWARNKEKILASPSSNKRVKGGGRKPVLGALEEILCKEIKERQQSGLAVTRDSLTERVRELASEHRIKLGASPQWMCTFLARHGLSLKKNAKLKSVNSPSSVVPLPMEKSEVVKATPPTTLGETTLVGVIEKTSAGFGDALLNTPIQGSKGAVKDEID